MFKGVKISWLSVCIFYDLMCMWVVNKCEFNCEM